MTPEQIASQIDREMDRHKLRMAELSAKLSLTVSAAYPGYNMKTCAEAYVKCACDLTGVHRKCIYGHSNFRNHCWIRYAIWHNLKRLFPASSLNDIAILFNRDRGTIINGYKQANALLSNGHEAQFRALVNGIENRFKECVK